MEQKIFPTWGYKPDGSAQIFNLREEDEDLPDGWSRRLEPWNHPNTRHLYSRPAEPAPEERMEARGVARDFGGDRGFDEEMHPKKRGPGRPRSPESTGL